MKRFLLIVLIIIPALIFASCTGGKQSAEAETGNSDTVSSSNIGVSVNADVPDLYTASSYYTYYQSAEKLVDAADFIISGKVADVSLEAFDYGMQKPFDKESHSENVRITTVYTIKPDCVYKGKCPEEVKVAFQCITEGCDISALEKAIWETGVKEVDVAPGERNQSFLRQLKEIGIDRVYYLSESCGELEIGKKYLVVLNKPGEDTPYSPLNPLQAIQDFSKPLEHKTDNALVVNVSASDIAAACGEESEKAFWAQWQNDNPNWRQRDDAKELSKIIEQKVTE